LGGSGAILGSGNVFPPVFAISSIFVFSSKPFLGPLPFDGEDDVDD
jgi:hypothetical protein